MVSIRVGKVTDKTENQLTIESGLSTYNFYNETSLTTEEFCVFTTSAFGQVHTVFEFQPFEKLIVKNVLSLTDGELLQIILEKTDTLNSIIAHLFAEPILNYIDDRLNSLGTIIDEIKVGSNFSRLYKPGEDNYKIYRIRIEPHWDSYLNSLQKQFKYNEDIQFWDDLSDPNSNERADYENELRKVEIALKRHLKDLHVPELHHKLIYDEQLKTLTSKTNRLFNRHVGDFTMLWEYYVREDHANFDLKYLLLALIKEQLDPQYSIGNTIGEYELWSFRDMVIA